ncbi:DUF5707 domain-containing protein [Streptomyces sp. NPDC013178]|uniref:DUF5707 domain-containing protein n=1 Tax=unclassified Streptomyces TaxID=2593676 RepID=UPI0033C99F41
MRIRNAAAAVSLGAVALTGLAVPAAQADEVRGDTKISNVVVNGGKPVVVGATGTKAVTVTFTVKDNSGVDWAQVILFHGADIESSDSGAVANSSDGRATCTTVNATTSNCKSTFTLKTGGNLINKVAGLWKVWAIAAGNDVDYVQKDYARGFNIQRSSKLTVNASPEPVRKGATITVTGALTRANWETHKFGGYSGQPVKLQYKKNGSTTWSTVKTVKTNSKGGLKTTVKATADGSFRYTFAGNAATAAVTTAGDYVDVR